MRLEARTAPTEGPLYPEDLALAAAVLRKDRKATAELVARFATPVHGYLRSRLIPRVELADDLAHDVFLTAWQSLGTYRGTSPLESWLLGIARHKIEDHYRARLRDFAELDGMEIDPADRSALAFDDALDRERIERKTRSILDAMPEDYSAALLWRYWEKASARQIAERTGRTEKAVERLLARARDYFRRRWTDGESAG